MKEEKVAPKFQTIFLKGSAEQNKNIQLLKAWCNKFIGSGLMPCYGEGILGNLSFRASGNSFYITASGQKDKISDNCFVHVKNVDIDNFKIFVEGEKHPSSESFLHYLIYKERKDVNAIFHGHYDKILRSAGQLKFPETKKEYPYGTLELANAVLKIIGSNNFITMKNHGFISLGRTMGEAGNLALDMLRNSQA